jgi:hypothetical protein
MERLLIRVTSLVAFAIVLATDILYVGLIGSQGQDFQPYVPRFVASYLAVMAALIVIALLPRPEIFAIRLPMRAAAAGGLLALGFLAAFSIGLPLVVAGVLTTVALTRTSRRPGSALRRLAGLGAALLAIGLLVAGLEITGRLIVCPETGTGSGTGSGLVTGSYSYECNQGSLRIH